MSMTATVDAIYESGQLRLLHALELPEHTRVRVSIETVGEADERQEWLAQGERTLIKVWNSDADDVYNALLTK